MIVKSFFRRTTTKIYITLLSIIIATVCVLNSLNVFLDNQANNIYINSMRLIVSTEEDLYDVLRKNGNIINIRRGFLLESPDDSIQIVNDDPNFYKPLHWSSFSYLTLTSVTAYLGSRDLILNEIELGFSSLDYYNSTLFLDDYLGKTITAHYQGEEINLVIKKVYDAGAFPEIKISKSIYDKLESKDNRYFYSSQIKHERFEEAIMHDLLKYKKEEDDKIVAPHIFTQSSDETNYNILEKMNSQIKILKNITNILSVIFFIMFIIISKNILRDLEITLKLEHMLGFNKKNIRINIIKRLFSIYAINLIISICISIVVSIILNKFNYNGFVIFNYKYFIKVTLLLVFSNMLLLIFLGSKLDRK